MASAPILQAAAIVAVVALVASSFGNAWATRVLLQDDAAGTVLTGPHTETKTATIAANGCQTFETTPDRPSFIYNSTVSYAALPSGCSSSDLEATKVYARGACPETRANNYAVKALGITSPTGCVGIASNSSATCTSTFAAAPSKAIVSNLRSGQQLDNGEICWAASFVYVFVKNSCASPITVVITNDFNDYSGSCTAGDGDDGDTTDTASNSGGDLAGSAASTGGLSTGAKVGIAIGVIAAVFIIAAAVYFLCCQLRK